MGRTNFPKKQEKMSILVYSPAIICAFYGVCHFVVERNTSKREGKNLPKKFMITIEYRKGWATQRLKYRSNSGTYKQEIARNLCCFEFVLVFEHTQKKKKRKQQPAITKRTEKRIIELRSAKSRLHNTIINKRPRIHFLKFPNHWDFSRWSQIHQIQLPTTLIEWKH